MAYRILVVDDEPAIHELVAEYLRGRGMEAHVARTGREARAFLSSGPFDLVLVDLRLADCDGIELVHLAARHRPPVPAIAMTAYGSVESAVHALRSGAQDYLSKPFKLREVHAAIERAIQRAAEERDALFNRAAVAWIQRLEVAESVDRVQVLAEELPRVLGLHPMVEVAERLPAESNGDAPMAATGGAIHFLGDGTWLHVLPDDAVAVPYALATARAMARCKAP
jgi:DNA-binding NtrC family response regulator